MTSIYHSFVFLDHFEIAMKLWTSLSPPFFLCPFPLVQTAYTGAGIDWLVLWLANGAFTVYVFPLGFCPLLLSHSHAILASQLVLFPQSAYFLSLQMARMHILFIMEARGLSILHMYVQQSG